MKKRISDNLCFHWNGCVALNLQWMVALAVMSGCANGGDSKTISMINKLEPHVVALTERGEDGTERIVGIGINFRGPSTLSKQREVTQLVSHLPKLEYLRRLGFGQDTTDDDLKNLPPLPNLKVLELSQTDVTDEGLKYIVGMKNLERLELAQTQLRGPGLAHLKGFTKLERLNLGATPLDDSAIPHIVANFPKLRRFDFGNTKVTPDGLMKLVDLHWISHLGPPNDIIGPDYKKAQDPLERSRLKKKRFDARIQFFGKFVEALLASRRKARAAGMDVPPDHLLPFGSSWYTYQRLRKEKEKNDKPLEKEPQRQK